MLNVEIFIANNLSENRNLSAFNKPAYIFYE